MAKTITVHVGAGELIELVSGWRDLLLDELDTEYWLRVRYKTVGLARHYLVPVGEPTGALGLAVKLVKLPKLRKREG